MSADTVDAVACGALGCTNSQELQRYEQDGVVRTLCPSCGERFTEGNA